MRKLSAIFPACLLAGGLALTAYGADKDPGQRGSVNIQKEVRHELVTLSRYGVFDNLSYRVDGTRVTLLGQATQPILKIDAENAVKGIAGVTAVDNQIEVLPLSPMDDGIRRAEFRAIYGSSDLSRYSFQAIPSIHIIVKNGNVTLEGFVANDMDKNVAGIRANMVPGVFSVTNNLRTDKSL